MTVSPTATPLIEGVGVGKVFPDFWGRPRIRAVDHVDITVRQGSVFGLLGPNGAGKSTLIKLILGHLYPTAGRLLVFGKDPRDVASKAQLGYLPERALLYRNLTAEETLHFFGEILGLAAPEIQARTQQLLAMTGLEGSRRRLVGEFSHGMMRRLGLAQALLNDPDLLLLDEPTAGLDPLGCRDVKNLILTLARRGRTILLTSHLLADVEDVCDEILIMFGGQVLAHGSVAELLARKDSLQIRTPTLPPEVLRQVTDLLQRAVPAEQVELSSPTRSLESYFLDVVRQASQNRQTSGAELSKGVAGYLRAGLGEGEMGPERRSASPAPAPVDEVALATLADAAPRPPATPPEPAAPTSGQVADDQALAGLAAGEKPAPAESAPKAPDVDEDLLDQLSGRQ